ncbi:hypothetical protein HYV43_03260 [Candidatus Micrarchaeota archaeon]|nr:hypothetical protein [Candidatus Micrarchaeota archaeon]
MERKTETGKKARNSAKGRRAQTAIEYVMMISATVVFITLTAFFIKTRVIAP